MEKKPFLSAIEKLDARIFFTLLFLYQVIFIFQGFDIADEGFHAIFYQQIYRDPESVGYNFMFWFSGIVGGAFSSIFSGLGLWGIRLAGVITITSTIIISYNLLKKYLNPGYLKIGLFLALILLNNNRKTLYYDNLSLLFYVAIIYFLFAGLKENKWWKLFLSGCFIGLNVFTRPPNIMALGLGIVILYYGYLYRNSIAQQFRQVVYWVSGLLFSSAILLLFMKLIGHYDIFINSLKLIFSLGADESNRNYGALNLIKNYYPPYKNSLVYTILVLVIIGLAIIIPGLIKRKNSLLTLMKFGIRYGLLAIVLYIIWKDKDANVVPLYLFTGLTIITGIMILLSPHTSKDIKVLMLSGCFLVAVYPFGSSAGLYTVGINTFWIAFPIGIDYLFSITSLQSEIKLSREGSSWNMNWGIGTDRFRQIRTYGLVLLTFACLLHAYFYPYFDMHNRMKMHYSLNSDRLKGIFTTKERAESFNELMAESAKYMKPGDYVLAYDCMPMFHYATKTKPFLHNSWPYLYPKDVFKEELLNASQSKGQLPVVVQQTIKTIGSGSDWPTTPLKKDPEWEERNKGRNEYLNEFLSEHHYKEVWTNGVFKIFVPEDRSA